MIRDEKWKYDIKREAVNTSALSYCLIVKGK